MSMSKKTLINRVEKMVTHPKFTCQAGCPKRKRYFQVGKYIKGERGNNDTCKMCLELFRNPLRHAGCPCHSFETQKEVIAHTLEIIKRERNKK